MFSFAIITILFSYSFFFLGIVKLLSAQYIIFISVIYFLVIIFLIKNNVVLREIPYKKITKEKSIWIPLLLLLVLVSIVFLDTLGPETSFDALWYHLTLPKLYLAKQSIFFVPGGVLYYSAMPKLGELLFIPSLFFGGETVAKAVQFIFSLLTLVVLYKVSRRYVSGSLSVITCLIFYSNIVVCWEASVGYIDIIRAFFEVSAFYAMILWIEKKSLPFLVLLGVLIGGAMMTKILAVSSLCIFIVLLCYIQWKNNRSILSLLWHSFLVSIISLLVISPWIIFSYIHTGNPFYPFFTSIYKTQIADNAFSFSTFFQDFFKIFLFSDDPISPIYILILPLVIVAFTKLSEKAKLVGFYCVGAFLFWYLTPRTGGGRFILPYLPVFSILVVLIIDYFKRKQVIMFSMYFAVYFIACTTILYRGVASVRYLPVLFGLESKSHYLSKHLNFSYGDFYDTDGYLANHINSSDRVLLYGFHNFYYISFPFIDSSWVKKGDTFTYIATQNTILPKRFHTWKLVYQNPKTGVKLYNDGSIWKY